MCDVLISQVSWPEQCSYNHFDISLSLINFPKGFLIFFGVWIFEKLRLYNHKSRHGRIHSQHIQSAVVKLQPEPYQWCSSNRHLLQIEKLQKVVEVCSQTCHVMAMQGWVRITMEAQVQSVNTAGNAKSRDVAWEVLPADTAMPRPPRHLRQQCSTYWGIRV